MGIIRCVRRCVFLGLLFDVGVKQHPHHQQADADADADIGKIEDGKIHKQDVDVIDHHAGGNAVDQIADATAQHKGPGHAFEQGQLAGKQHPQHAQQHQRRDPDQQRLLTGQHRKCHTIV